MAGKGWVSVHRKIQDNVLWQDKPFSKGQAWIDILLDVNHRENEVLLGNEIIKVESGEMITSIRKLCDRWGWSNTKVRNFLELLTKQDMITYKSDTKKTLVKVLNYSDYQGLDICKNDAKTHQKHNKNTSKTHQKHTNNNVNNSNNENNDNKEQKKPAVPYQKIKELYNEICGDELLSIRTMSDRRRKHLRARWNEEGNLDIFEYLFKKTIESDFLTGDNDRGWKADFDWLIKNETNFNKVLEGRYENNGKKGKQNEQDDRLARIYQEYQNEEESVNVL